MIDPDAGGIPSQFPVQEDTQFFQILREAIDFFGIEENKQKEYFLVDHKTRNKKIIFLRKYLLFFRNFRPNSKSVFIRSRLLFFQTFSIPPIRTSPYGTSQSF